MSRKIILALAAVATLATAFIVTADDANARPGGHGGGVSRGGGGGGGMARAHGGGGGRHVGGMRHAGMKHIGMRHHHHFRPRHHAHFWPRPFCWRFPWRCRGPIYTRYVARTYVAASPVAYAAAPAAPSRCTCLTKQYLQDGSVLFKDVCTREEALMPNPNQQQSELPQQTPGPLAYQAPVASPQAPPAPYQAQPPYQGQVPYQQQPQAR